MPSRRAALALAFPALLPPCAASAEAAPRPLGHAFHERCLAPDGRVVDTGNAGISRPEGQGWGMLAGRAAAPVGAAHLGPARMMRLAPGDLMQYLASAQRSTFGPEESPIREALPPGGPAALVEKDVSDVQVAGTSNVQPRFGFAAMRAPPFERPVGLARAPNGIGPHAALPEFVRGAGRPRVIARRHPENDLARLPDGQASRAAPMSGAAFLAALPGAPAA